MNRFCWQASSLPCNENFLYLVADRVGNVGKLIQFTCIANGNHIWQRGQTLWSVTVTIPASKMTVIVKPCNMHVMEY